MTKKELISELVKLGLTKDFAKKFFKNMSKHGYIWDEIYIGKCLYTIYYHKGHGFIKKRKGYSMAACKRDIGLHFTIKHRGKMTNVKSLSTSSKLNEHCRKRCNLKCSICSRCYSNVMSDVYSDLDKCLRTNTEILSHTIPWDKIPYLDCEVFRFEAFGDLSSVAQVINYFAIAKKNPLVKCALWTKNPRYIQLTIERGFEVPDNLIIIYSSPIINRRVSEKVFSIYPFIDKIFTVYDSNDATINCGARSCYSCRRCYSKRTTKHVNEKLK